MNNKELSTGSDVPSVPKKKFDIVGLSKQNEKAKSLPLSKAVSAPLGKKGAKKYKNLTADSKITFEDGRSGTAQQLFEYMNVGDKQVIHCPSPEHDDRHPSAFIEKQGNDKLFYSCSSCQAKGFYQSQEKVEPKVIDKEAILNSLALVEMSILMIASLIVQYLPRFIVSTIANVVENILTNSLFPIGKVKGRLRIYYLGYWRAFNTEDEQRYFIKQCIEKSAMNPLRATKNQIDSVLENLLEEYRPFCPSSNSVYLNQSNGVLEIGHDGTIVLHPHSENYDFIYKLDLAYNPDAGTTFVTEFFLNAVEEQEALDVIFEFIASSFIPTDILNMEVMLILLGDGSNGKSMLLDAIINTLGKENVSTLEMSDFKNDTKLLTASGKILNIGTELNSKSFDSSLFKRITSNENVTVDRKYKSAITITQFPKLLFAANKLFENTGDNSHGFYRRLKIVKFDKRFDHTKKDPELRKKLMEHKHQVLTLIIEALQRFLLKKEFTYSPKIASAQLEYESSQDSVRAFVTNCEVTMPKDGQPVFTIVKVIFTAYQAYCQEEGRIPKGKNKFLKRFKALGFAEYKSGNKRGYRAVINKPVEQENSIFAVQDSSTPFGKKFSE